MDPVSLPPLAGRKDRTTVILAAIVGGVSVAMLAAVYLLMGGSETPAVRAKTGPIFGEPAQTAPAPAPMLPIQTQPAPDLSQPASDSLSFVTNKDGSPLEGGRGTVSATELAREKQFLQQYGGALKNCQAGINSMILKHWKANPVLREMDAELTRLDKFMAVKRRYQHDGDMYQWARDTAALPELRATIRKYMARPEAWSVGIDIALDVIKTAPAPVYKEFVRMMVTDPALSKFTNEVAVEGAAHLPGAMTAAIAKGRDIAPLQKAMTDLSISK